MAGTDFWGRFQHDPRHPQHGHLRAADRDRDVVADLLGAAYADGRLDRAEFDERSERVSHAKILGDLPPLVGDLVSPVPLAPPAPAAPSALLLRNDAERRYLALRHQALMRWLWPTLICWFVFLTMHATDLTEAFPWPFFVMLLTGVRYLRLRTHRDETVLAIERNLLSQQQRRWEAAQRSHRRALTHGRPAPFPPPPRRTPPLPPEPPRPWRQG